MRLATSLRRAATAIAGALLIAGGGAAFAADAPATTPSAPSKEMREKAATLHEQMAACLRSDKPIAECRSEMMKSCQSTMGNQNCPMMMGMGGGRMGRGQGMHGRMMTSPPSSSSAAPK